MLADLLDAFEERARDCATRLHDAVLQDLYALCLSARTLASEAIEARIGDIAAVVAGLVESLAPPVLDDFGLSAALCSLARTSGSRVEVHEVPGEAARLSRRTARYLFRVAQEGVERAARHSTGASVHLDVRSGAATITVDPSSGGADAPPLTAGHAAVHSSENGAADRLGHVRAASYARALGGTLAVCESTEGAVYRASVPLSQPPA